MRQKRAKTYKKLMHLYSMTFGFREPYQVILDSLMCKSAVELKVDLLKQLATVLHGNVKPMITQCCMHELYLQGKSLQPAVDLAKTFERRKCNHREAIPGDECISSIVEPGNKHRYVIATQSHSLRVRLRNTPAVPIVHINRTVMVIEPPSDATVEAKQTMEEQSLKPSTSELAIVDSSQPVVRPRKKKGPKGPNPLSVRKKTKRGPLDTQDEITRVGQKRKRVATDVGGQGEDVREFRSPLQGQLPKKRRRKASPMRSSAHQPLESKSKLSPFKL